ELHELSDPISLSHDKIDAGQYVLISVADSGAGMDGPMLDRIFEPFFTTRPNGNGLGLATVRELVHDHGGRLNVRSRPRDGSRFDVWLSRVAGGVWAAERRSAARAPGRGEGVMLVAADSDRLLGDEEMLAALGYEAVGFATAEAARAAGKAAPSRFD